MGKNSKKTQAMYDEIVRLKRLNQELQARLAAQSATEDIEDAEFTEHNASDQQPATNTASSINNQENLLNRFGTKLGLSLSDIAELNTLFENGTKEQRKAVNAAVGKKAVLNRASGELADIIAAMVSGDSVELVKEVFSKEKSDDDKLLDRIAATMKADYLKERGLVNPIF